MKKKRLPDWISNHFLQKALQSRAGTYFSYWLFQGMLYMDCRESAVKCSFDIIFTFLLWWAIGLSWYICLIIAHTMNMLLNGHFFAMQRHLGLGANKPEYFITYIEDLHQRIRKKTYILGAAAFGSLSKNIYRPTSDIDIRFVPQEGQKAFFFTCLFALCERARAFFSRFPLDLYVFELDDLTTKMNSKEPPIIFLDPQKILTDKYGEIVDVDGFITKFKHTYV